MALLVIFCTIFIVILFLSSYFTYKLINVKSEDNEITWQKGLDEGWLLKKFLKTTRENFSLSPSEGQSINGTLIDRGGEKTIVFVHGHSVNWITMVKYFGPFLGDDWNIVAFDNRGHGRSQGRKASYGYWEKQDLAHVFSWVRRRFPQSNHFGLYGESLGAATVMEYSILDKGLDFIIADCGYSDFRELLLHQLKYRSVPAPLRYPVLFCANILLRIVMGFWMSQVSPKKAVLKSQTPLLLFHGGDDNYVPTTMSRDIYEARQDLAPTTLCIIPGAGHAKSILTDFKVYNNTVEKFLETIIKLGGRSD